MAQRPSSTSLRRLYLAWVEEQIEEFKDSIPRSELLCLADEVVVNLDVNRRGQYQLTELLLVEEVDRAIFRKLKLPRYAVWSACYLESLSQEPPEKESPEEEPIEVPPARAVSF